MGTSVPIEWPVNSKLDPRKTYWDGPLFSDTNVSVAQQDEYIGLTRLFYNNLEDYDKMVVLWYMQDAIELNAFWRSGKPLMHYERIEAAAIRDRLVSIISRAPPLPFDLTVYRAINTKLPTMRDNGFISTTTDLETLADQLSPITLKIRLPQGSRNGFFMGAVAGGHSEFLLQAGLKLKRVRSCFRLCC